MNNKIFLCLIISSSIPATACAGTMGVMQSEPDVRWVTTISAGPTWSNAGENQTFDLAPSIEKAYIANKSTNTLGAGELFIGVQKQVSDWQGQIGLAGAVSGNAKLQGIIWDDANPKSYNYSYHYKILHSHVALKGKLLKDQGYWLIPWISGSLGVGFNHASGFDNYPLIAAARPNCNFKSNTETAFTYTVGAGLQKSLNDHWQLGVGYEFADWGKSRLDKAPEQTINTGLKLNHLYTNGVLFNLTYIA